MASSRVLYRSEAATLALYNTRPSSARHRPSRVCTLLLTATWVCRSGSPARESRWVNTAAISPEVSTCRTPPAPSRVKTACRSSQASVSATAAAWAASTCSATFRGASAHSAETDFTGENVRS